MNRVGEDEGGEAEEETRCIALDGRTEQARHTSTPRLCPAHTKPGRGLNPAGLSQDLVKYSGVFDSVPGVCLLRHATLALTGEAREIGKGEGGERHCTRCQ